MPNTIIIDDSPFAQAVALLCDLPAENILGEQTLLETLLESQNPVDRILLHTAHGKGMRTTALGVELMTRIRRDLRFDGEIMLYSIESLGTLAAKHPPLRFFESGDHGDWNISFFVLPDERNALQNATKLQQSQRLSPEIFTDFLMRHCGLDSYFPSQWSNVSHWLQGNNWATRLLEPDFKILLQNSKELGPLWRARRVGIVSPIEPTVGEALDFLGSLTNNNIDQDTNAVRNAVDTVQAWLTGAEAQTVTLSQTIQPPPRSALRECSLVLIADDDPYDASGLEALGYSVRVNTRSPAEARAYLEESPHVFLCDLRWKGDATMGIELTKIAVANNVKVVILMSAGPIPTEDLPPGVVPCPFLQNKTSAEHVHRLIVNAYEAQKRES